MVEKTAVRSSTRQANTRVVIETLRRAGPSSQAQIARLTGLSRAAVNGLVQRLAAEGVIESTQVNGRESLVSLRSRYGTFVTLEVDPHTVRAALFDFVGERRFDARLSTADSTSPEMVAEIVGRIADDAGLERTSISSVAIAFDAPILRSNGAIASWAWQRMPKWKGVPLEETLGGLLGVPTLVDNDANLAALAEWTWGAAQGCDDFMFVMCSTGVGGALIIDGRIYRGGTGMAGEIGHMVVEEAGGLCFCGSRGCLSGFVSERAILATLAASDRDRTSLADVVSGAHSDDAACQRVLFEAGRHLGKALAAAARLVAPSMVTIGGTLATAEPFVTDGLQSSAEIINLRAIAPSIRFCPAQLAPDAVMLGALAAALAHADQGSSELAPWMRGVAVAPQAAVAT